jgi:hypothetical protein
VEKCVQKIVKTKLYKLDVVDKTREEEGLHYHYHSLHWQVVCGVAHWDTLDESLVF